MNNTTRPYAGMLIPLSSILGALILALINGYFYVFRTDVTDVDGIYQTILLKNDGSDLILGALFIVFLTALTVFSLILMKKTPPAAPSTDDGLPSVFARCIAGAVTVSTLVMYFVLSPAATPYEQTPSNGYIVTASILLALPAALYFLLPGLFSLKNKAVLFFLGLCALLFLACELLLTHYFMLDFLSSPTRVFAVFGYSALTLFMLLDLKRLAHAPSGNRLRVILALWAFVINTADALPRLILSFMAKDPFFVTLTTFHTLLRLTLGIYALVSILPLLKKAKEEPAPCKEEEGPSSKNEEEPLFEKDETANDQEPIPSSKEETAEQEEAEPSPESYGDDRINENQQGDTANNG